MKVDNFEVLAWLCSEAADDIERLAAAKEQHFAQAMENGAKANAYRAALDEVVATERERLRVLVEAVRDANRDAEDGDTFRLLKPGQERAWLALLAGLKGPNAFELTGKPGSYRR